MRKFLKQLIIAKQTYNTMEDNFFTQLEGTLSGDINGTISGQIQGLVSGSIGQPLTAEIKIQSGDNEPIFGTLIINQQ